MDTININHSYNKPAFTLCQEAQCTKHFIYSILFNLQKIIW